MKSITPLLALSGAAVIGLTLASCKPEREEHEGMHAAQFANNLKYVKCKRDIAGATGPVEIPVYGRPHLDRDDEVYFVCKDEKVHWAAKDSEIVSFTVEFKNKSEWPFVEKEQALPEQPSGATADQTVAPLPANKYSKAHEYTITVQTKDHGTFTIDPHVIPMGP